MHARVGWQVRVGLRGWVRRKLSGSSPLLTSARVDLVEPRDLPVPVPKRVGLDRWQLVQPWSIARLTSLFREATHQPSESTLLAARVARHRLSSFWIEAPVDHLQHLYEGNLGALQQLLLESPLTPLRVTRRVSSCVCVSVPTDLVDICADRRLICLLSGGGV